MPMAEKAPTMASSSYSGGGGGATGLAPPIGLGESSSNEEQGVGPVAGRSNRRDGTNAALDDSWDPQIIAEGGQPVASGGGGGGTTRHITSTAGGDRPSAAQTAAAAAALSAAAGGPAAPSADVGVEVSPTHESKHDESLLATSRGSAEEAAAAEQAMKRQAQSPLLACVDEASVLFREKMNCEYFEERQPSPHKRRHGGDDSDVTSLTPSQKQKQQKQKQQVGGRVVTVGGQTAVTSAKSLNPPSTKGVRGIIEESEEMADEPSPHSARKKQAFFSQLDVNDVKSGTEDEAEEQRQQSPGVTVGRTGRAAAVSDDDSYFSYDRQMQEEMPEDEFNESVGGTPPQSPPSSPKGRNIGSSIEAEEEEGIMAGMFKTVSDMCNVDGGSNTKAAAVGGAAAVGVGAAAAAAGSTSKDGTTEESERGLMTDEEGALDLDICTYLQNICGTPVAADDEAPPPPPPFMAGVSASNSRESYDERAAQLDLSATRSADQQENTAIEVEYVDPDYYTSDEEDTGEAGQYRSADASKKKRKGLGLGKAGKGLSKRMFGKSKKKVGHHDSEEKKDEGEAAKIAAAVGAAAAVGTAAAVGAAGMQDRPDDEEDSQGTADHVDDLDEEPEVVRVPNDGLGLPFDENAAADKGLGSESWTVDEKNAHLQAMADKAKDDYMYGKGSPPPSPDRSRDADAAADDSSVPEDDYADWRPSEKRRFLQLLSQGMSPRESARVIKNTRRGVEQPELSPSASSDVAATSESFDGDVIPHPEHDEEKKGEDGDIVQGKADEDDYDEGKPEEGDREVAEAKTRESTGGVIGQEEEGVMEEKETDNSVMAAALAGGITAAAVGAAVAIKREDAAPADALDETGVSYYDGVKRDDPRDFADAKEAVDTSATSSQGAMQDVASSKAKRGKILSGSLKSKGFASLDSDVATSDTEGRGQSKKSNRKGFSSRLLPGKGRKTKDGFSTLDSDESENEFDEEFAGERNASIIKMLRPRPAGFQKMASTGDGMQDSETEASQPGVSSPKDDDTLFDFNEDDTVAAAGGTSPRAQSQLHTIEDDNTESEIPPSSEMSVVSGLTMNTAYTDAMSVGTSATGASGKSTRRRHRGAAKKRLSKAKEMEDGKSVGWLDSIRAAAATNNRVWDPQLGWVDYSEPENKSDTLDDSGSVDRIGPLSLSGKVGKSHGAADENGGDESKAQSEAKSTLPFPEDWEEERSQMIDESYEGNQTDPDVMKQAPDAAIAPIESDEDNEATSDTMPLVAAAATTAAVASTIPLVVSSKKDRASDDMTTTSGLTTQTGNRSPGGTPQRRDAPKGWVESMKAAAANVSANDPNRRWDPEHGWIGLPPGTVPPAETGNEGASSNLNLEDGAESSQLNTSRASRSSRGSGPVDVDSEDIGSSTDEEEEQGPDAEVDRVAVNTSMISERSAGPVDLDDSDFDDDDSEAESSIPDPPEAPVARDAPDAPEGAEDPPAAQDVEGSSLSTATTALAAGAAVATGAALATTMASNDAADSNASAPAQAESTSSREAKPFRLPVPKLGRGRGTAQDGYDELASVTSEMRYAEIENTARTPKADEGSIDPQKAERYEQFKWDQNKGAATSAASGVGSTLPPKVPTKGSYANAEKSAPDVQVIKLKMSEKDKDLFLNKDDSAHFIDDTNFAPEFTDESPFGTPSRPAPRGIEVKDNDIDLDVTASDIVPPQDTEGNEGVLLRDPPGAVPVAGAAVAAAAVAAAGAGAVSADRKAEESSVSTRSTLQGEGIDAASVQSVSSRAKQWMELMDSKSKSRVSSTRDIKSRGVSTPSNAQDTQDTAADVGATESKSEASSAVEWPGAGSSARRSKSQRGDEWKSFLGKKGQVSAPKPQQPQTGGVGGDAFVFSAADGGSEAGIDVSGAGFTTQQRKGRSAASNVTDATDEDSIFMFNSGETNPLKAKLQDMSPMKQQQQKERSSSAAAPGSSATSGSSEGEGGQDNGGDGKDKKSFLKRMAECAAPVIPAGCANPTQVDETGQEVPVSHLEFLKNSKVVGSTKDKLKEISPSTLCGRPDTIIEEKDDKGKTRGVPAQEATKPVRSSKGSSASSVVSGDGFGAKSAYLDAIALKAATKNPRRKSGGRSSSSAAGSASSQRSNESSEAWQGFMERRRSSSKSPGPGSAPAASAEEKAAQKVEEMMKAMAMSTKSKEDIDDMIDTMSMSNASATLPSRDPIERSRSGVSRQSKPNQKSESAKAAEELAAARVEAMMKAMSSQNLDDEEI